MRGSDSAWNRWLTVIQSHPEEGLFFSDLMALVILSSLMQRFVSRSMILLVCPQIEQFFVVMICEALSCVWALWVHIQLNVEAFSFTDLLIFTCSAVRSFLSDIVSL